MAPKYLAARWFRIAGGRQITEIRINPSKYVTMSFWLCNAKTKINAQIGSQRRGSNRHC